MTERLFSHHELRGTLGDLEQTMLKEIRTLNEGHALNTSQEELRNYFAQKYSVEIPQIDEGNITTDHGDAQIDVSRRHEYFVRDRNRQYLITGTRVTFYVPFTGDGQLFHCYTSTRSLSPPRALVKNDELQFIYERTANDTEKIPQEFQADLKGLKDSLAWIRSDLTNFNNAILEKIDQELTTEERNYCRTET